MTLEPDHSKTDARKRLSERRQSLLVAVERLHRQKVLAEIARRRRMQQHPTGTTDEQYDRAYRRHLVPSIEAGEGGPAEAQPKGSKQRPPGKKGRKQKRSKSTTRSSPLAEWSKDDLCWKLGKGLPSAPLDKALPPIKWSEQNLAGELMASLQPNNWTVRMPEELLVSLKELATRQDQSPRHPAPKVLAHLGVWELPVNLGISLLGLELWHALRADGLHNMIL